MKASFGFFFAVVGTFACSSTPETPAATGGQGGQAPTSGTNAGGSSAGSAVVAGSSGSAVGGSVGTAGSNTSGSGGINASGAGGTTGGASGASGSGGGGGSGGTASKPVCPAGPFDKPQAGNAMTVCQGFQYQHGYSEGPTWVASQGAFYFSNFTQGAQGGNITGDIIKYTPGGMCEFFVKDVGTNGLAVANDGNLLGATHKTRSVSEFDIKTGAPKVLSDMYMGQMLDSPNDLVQSSTGNIYFSNPIYELGPNRQPGVGGAIFRRDPQGNLTLIKKAGAPNGVAISPKEDRLYVVDGGQWDLDAAGVATNNRDFQLGGADGLAVDCAGNVYLSNGSIRDPANGNEIAKFSGGTNLAFGGTDGKTLIVIGGGTNVKIIPMNVPGLP